MFEAHPEFKPPPNPQIPIWRYTDLPKFISLLDEKALYFARADTLPDPFEGSLPVSAVKARLEVCKRLGIDPDHWGEVARWRRYVALNCWHMNEHESAAMWNQYGVSGVAVQSTYERLRDAIVDTVPIRIGCVEYRDYSKDEMRDNHVLTPFLSKRKSFEHEKELRACIWRPPFKPGESKADWIETIDRGCHIAVELPLLVERVFVAPASPAWFTRVVKSTVQRFGFDFPVLQSRLDESPVF